VLAYPSDLGRRGYDLLYSRYTAHHLVDRVEGVYESLLSPDTAPRRPAPEEGLTRALGAEDDRQDAQ